MCGRFYLPENDVSEELMELLKNLNRTEPVKSSGELCPGDTIPVLCRSRSGAPHPFAMKWGYSLQGRLIFNARSETALQKPLFREGMLERRCLLPAAHYFEWEKKETGKLRYTLKPRDTGLFFLAGLYRFEQEKPVCTVLTRAPAEEISFIHDRMPVMLPLSMKEDWLNVKNDPLEMLRCALTQMSFIPDPS